MYYPGFDIKIKEKELEYTYGKGVFGPKVEKRYLDSIRKTLLNEKSDGPEIVYSIAMDVGMEEDREKLLKSNLLYGTVIYSKGKIGEEPVRSQGHIHSISKSIKSSTPEVYEIWNGEAIIYMQKEISEAEGISYGVFAKEGEIVIVPPGWAHCTISANPNKNLVFGAWCVRDYGFDYDIVRKKSGLAYFPILNRNNKIDWIENDNWKNYKLILKSPREYKEFDIGVEPIYTQFKKNNEKFKFVSNPNLKKKEWKNFIP